MASTLAAAFYAKGKVVLVQPLGGTVRLGSVGYLNDEQWVEVTTVKKMFGLPSMPSASALAASYRPLEAIFTWWKPWMTWMLSVLAPLGTVRPSTEMAPGWLGRPMWIETYGMSIRHEL